MIKKVFIAFDNGVDLDDNTQRIIGVYSSYEKAKDAIYKAMTEDGDFCSNDEIIYDEDGEFFEYDDGSGCYKILERGCV